MGLDINVNGSMVEWSRLLDFCTETSNTCSGVFKRWKTFRNNMWFPLTYFAIPKVNAVCAFYIPIKMRIRVHMGNILVLLNVRNLTSCATVSIPRTLLPVINYEFPIVVTWTLCGQVTFCLEKLNMANMFILHGSQSEAAIYW